jgi:hypothetical protein
VRANLGTDRGASQVDFIEFGNVAFHEVQILAQGVREGFELLFL